MPLALQAFCFADGVAASLPDGLKAEFVVRFEKGLSAEQQRAIHFDVDRDGKPFLLVRNTLVAVREKFDPALDALKIAGIERVECAAWMPDGSLLIVTGKDLGEVTAKGFRKIVELPATGMKVAPATAEECYLFGGDAAELKGDVYLYRKGGGLLRLVRSQSPIGAVAGGGRYTFFAAGSTVYLIAEGAPVRAVFTAEGDVTSLAPANAGGVLFSTATGVGYIGRPGLGFVFLRGKGALVRSRGDAFYVFFPESGVMRGRPAALLEKMARDLALSKSGGVTLTVAAKAALDRGIDAAQRKDWDSATREFRLAREEAPYAPEPLMNLAVAAEGAGGREVVAIHWYRAYLASAATAPDAPVVRAKIAELAARVQANARRLRAEGMEGLRVAAIGATGGDRDAILETLAGFQVDANDIGGARVSLSQMTDAWKKDWTLRRIGMWQAEHGDHGGALVTVRTMSESSRGSNVVYEVARQQAKVGAIDAAIATVRTQGNPAGEATDFGRLAEEILATGRHDDAVGLAKLEGTPLTLQRIYAGIAAKQAAEGRVDDARRTVALVSVQDVSDSLVAMRVAFACAATGDFDDARAAAGRIPWSTMYFYRVIALKEIVSRLQKKGDVETARRVIAEFRDAIPALEKDYARSYAWGQLAEMQNTVGDAAGASASAWMIEDDYLRDSALARMLDLRGDIARAEIDSWALSVRFYEKYPLSYAALSDLKAFLESLKGNRPESVCASLATSAERLEYALNSAAGSETHWQQRRSGAK